MPIFHGSSLNWPPWVLPDSHTGWYSCHLRQQTSEPGTAPLDNEELRREEGEKTQNLFMQETEQTPGLIASVSLCPSRTSAQRCLVLDLKSFRQQQRGLPSAHGPWLRLSGGRPFRMRVWLAPVLQGRRPASRQGDAPPHLALRRHPPMLATVSRCSIVPWLENSQSGAGRWPVSPSILSSDRGRCQVLQRERPGRAIGE